MIKIFLEGDVMLAIEFAQRYSDSKAAFEVSK